MKLSDLITSLEIFKKYHGENAYCYGAEHDQFYVYQTNERMESEDIQKLVNFGWFQMEVDTGDDEFNASHYNSEESWTFYT